MVDTKSVQLSSRFPKLWRLLANWPGPWPATFTCESGMQLELYRDGTFYGLAADVEWAEANFGSLMEGLSDDDNAAATAARDIAAGVRPNQQAIWRRAKKAAQGAGPGEDEANLEISQGEQDLGAGDCSSDTL